jgi:hypothetical protein
LHAKEAPGIIAVAGPEDPVMKTPVRASVLVPLFGAALAVAQPFGTSGPEFRVNTTTGDERTPAVGMDANGAFLVTWKSSTHELFGQRSARLGAPLGGEFRVNSSTGNYPYWPALAGGASGRFVVVWESGVLAGTSFAAARWFQDGAPLATDQRVDNSTYFDQRPAVVTSSTGEFTVVWGRSPTPSNHWDLYGQRFSSLGAPLGGEFHVTTATTTQAAGSPRMAGRPDGSFLVTWAPNTFPAEVGTVFVQPYDATGAAVGSAFRANPSGPPTSSTPDASFDASGNFVVVWGGGFVWGQRFDAAYRRVGDAFRVDTDTSLSVETRVASASDGSFVVVWHTAFEYAVYARRYASTGAPLGGPFRVNTVRAGPSRLGDVAGDGAGNFVVVWQNGVSPTSDVLARRFCATLAGDANGDAAITVSDIFYLINALFAGGSAPVKGSDANGDGAVNVQDVFYLINYLFAGGPGPSCV